MNTVSFISPRRLAVIFFGLLMYFPHGTARAAGAGGDSVVHIPKQADSSVVIVRDSVVPPEKYLPTPYEMITNLPEDWWLWGKKTFRTDQIPLIASLSAITGGTIVTDYESWQLLKEPYDRYKWFRDYSDISAYIGDGKVQGSIAAAFALYGFVFRDTTALRTASQTVEVILACGGMVQLLKHLTGRESPIVTTTPTGRWRFFPNQIEYHKHVPHYDAFPSGHIATSLATLTVIAENYPQEKWILWVGYPIIASVGIGLVATSIHWVSDLPLGIALGYSFGMTVAHRNDPEPQNNPDKKMGYNFTQPPKIGATVMSDGTPGVSVTWQW